MQFLLLTGRPTMMTPMRHYPEGDGKEGQGPPKVEKESSFLGESGEHVVNQRRIRRRQEDRERDDFIENTKNLTLTPRMIWWAGVTLLALNQGANWWREKNVDPKQFMELKVTVTKLATVVDTLRDEFRDSQRDSDFKNYAICVQLKTQNAERYPRFCDSPEIQRFDPNR